jgi:hypothetical protein
MEVTMWWKMPQSFSSTGARLAAAALMALPLAWPQSTRAQADDADKILQAMSNYMAAQKNVSFAFDADIEVITSDIQKIQFASSGNVLLSRPDRIRVSRTGGYTDVLLVSDGKTATVLSKDANTFAQIHSPGSVDQLIDRLRDQLGVPLPGADFLSSNPHDVLAADVLKGTHVGRGVIDGVECEHLAFRNQDTDWQLWVEVGDRPIPHKFVITSKTQAAAPQYTLRIRDWKTDPQPAADSFIFTPPDGAKKIALKELRDIDEVPPGLVTGAQQ